MKSFIATVLLQHRSRAPLALIVLAIAGVSALTGYWAGQSAPSAQMLEPQLAAAQILDTPLLAPVQAPIAIVNASARTDRPRSTTHLQTSQFTQTVGKLHAEILTLRMLYRRLAEDAGLDLTDFELDDAFTPPTQTDEAVDSLGALNEELQRIKESSSAMADWYELRSQERAFKLAGPVVMHGQLSSRFGWRERPSTGEMKLHKGVDYSGYVGEPVLALADGVVSFAGKVHAYGNMVELMHADGLRTRYAHNDSNSVTLGQRVEQGQIIAKLGSTGRSTGPHVHVEVHLNGEAVDPMLFIQ